MALKSIQPLELSDTSPMPFGQKYRGVPMQDVPTSYLHWLWTSSKHQVLTREHQAVIDYIKKSIGALKLENPDFIW